MGGGGGSTKQHAISKTLLCTPDKLLTQFQPQKEFYTRIDLYMCVYKHTHLLILDSPPSHCLPRPSLNRVVYLLVDITSHTLIPPTQELLPREPPLSAFPDSRMDFSVFAFLLQYISTSGNFRNKSEVRSLPSLNPERLPTILRIKVRAILLIHEAWYTDPIPDPAPAFPALPLFTCFIFTTLFDVSTAYKICYHSRHLLVC